MSKKHELKDTIIELVGFRVSDADQLVVAVLEDIECDLRETKTVDSVLRGLEHELVRKLRVTEDLIEEYYAGCHFFRLFILDTIRTYWEREMVCDHHSGSPHR